MLFESRFLPGIRDGSVTVTFRYWKRPRAVAGRVHRTAAGRVAIDDVDVLSGPESISEDEARAAGYGSAGELRADLRPAPGASLYRIRFHILDEPDPRAVLASGAAFTDDEATGLARRLAQLDGRAAAPWTREYLELIASHPARRAADLAAAAGRERLAFKQDVRKLKALGLTESLEVGYRLSPRGKAWLARSAVQGTGQRHNRDNG